MRHHLQEFLVVGHLQELDLLVFDLRILTHQDLSLEWPELEWLHCEFAEFSQQRAPEWEPEMRSETEPELGAEDEELRGTSENSELKLRS